MWLERDLGDVICIGMEALKLRVGELDLQEQHLDYC